MSDVILCDSEDDHFLELRNEIERRRRPQNRYSDVLRGVLVFFDCTETLFRFYDSAAMQPLKSITQVITEITSDAEKASSFIKATNRGAITLMIREYGRGTDFKNYDRAMLEAGGAHVVQAFFSTDLSEEIQIKGRCARQGAEGSYRYVKRLDNPKRYCWSPTTHMLFLSKAWCST